MAAVNHHRFLRWYPRAWRDRYGDEFLAFMQDRYGPENPPLAARLSIATGGIRERSRHSGLTGDSVPPSVRVRAGVLVVLVSWMAMVVAGASFAKMSEHFDTSLPVGAPAHHLADLSYTFIQIAAGVAGLVVIVGAALAVPAFLRYLRSGGWSSIRIHALRAVGGTLVTAATTAPLLIWARQLSAQQRNGGSIGYGILFVVWAALVVATLVLWTVLAVVTAPKVTFSRSVLAVEAAMASAVALAVVGILAATCLWWAVVAERAPTYLSGDSALPLNIRLVSTVGLMAIAAATAVTGTARIAQSVPEWRSS